MTSKEQELLKGFLSKTLNMDEEAVSGLFNEDGELLSMDAAIKADADRIAKYKKEKSEQLDRGLREGAEKVEKQIKKKYGIESDAIGIDLVDELVQLKVSEVSKMNDGDIEKNPEFIKRKAEWDKQMREKEKEFAEQMKAKESEFERSRVISRAKRAALELLERKNPILPKDATKANVWRETFLNEIAAGDYQVNSDGSIIVLDKDGKILTNEHGNSVDFADHVTSIADKYFDYQVADQRSSTGLKDDKGVGKMLTIKDEDEFIQKMRDAKSAEERAEIYKVWNSKK